MHMREHFYGIKKIEIKFWRIEIKKYILKQRFIYIFFLSKISSFHFEIILYSKEENRFITIILTNFEGDGWPHRHHLDKSKKYMWHPQRLFSIQHYASLFRYLP